MRTGAENRRVLIAAVVFAVLAMVLVVRMIVVLTQQPAAAAAAPAAAGQQGPQARRVPSARGSKLPAGDSLDPALRLELLKASEETEYKGSGRNIFAKYEPPPPPPPDPRTQEKKVYVPPPPPPIPLKFFGFATKAGEAKRVLLSSGEDTFIAAEGEVVNRRYRVLHIGVNSVEIEDVLSNNRQTIPLTQ